MLTFSSVIGNWHLNVVSWLQLFQAMDAVSGVMRVAHSATYILYFSISGNLCPVTCVYFMPWFIFMTS